MTPYTAHAQVVVGEEVYGRYREPTQAELEDIELYRRRYRSEFGVYPVGTHWIDAVKALVNLLRPGGITS